MITEGEVILSNQLKLFKRRVYANIEKASRLLGLIDVYSVFTLNLSGRCLDTAR